MSSAAGTHASRLNPYDLLVPPPGVADFACDLPDLAQVDYPALDAAIASRESRVLRVAGRMGVAKRRLRRFLRR